MLKRLLGILFTLAALATFVWVGMGSYTSWCFGGGEVVEEETLPVPADTVSADSAASADGAPAADSGSSAAESGNLAAAPQGPDADRSESPAGPATTSAAAADSLSSSAVR